MDYKQQLYLRIAVDERKFTISTTDGEKVGEFVYAQQDEGIYPYWAVQFIQVFLFNKVEFYLFLDQKC